MALRTADRNLLSQSCPEIKLNAVLGEGGNARVFSGECSTHGSVAVKFLLSDNTKRYGRFRDEVLVVTERLKDSPHVLPILDYSLPDLIGDEVFPWYSMPVAQRLFDGLSDKSWGTRLEVLVNFADGLESIHSNSVAHRDIKPDNLFILDGVCKFGDFGIASFPENSGLTGSKEPMGPWAFMSPEMLSTPKDADPFKADVYALAKTVWCVLTNRKIPFIGQYVSESSDGLSNYIQVGSERFIVEPIDELLRLSTGVEVSMRPNAQEFAEKLRQAIMTQTDFRAANLSQWQAAELTSLTTSLPIRSVWSGVTEIAGVLTLMGRRDGLNHCFFPDGGGHTIEEAIPTEGGQMLCLKLSSKSDMVFKPSKLTLERFPNHPALSYLVLETRDSDPLGVNTRYRSEDAELLRRLNEFDYVVHDVDDYEPRNLSIGRFCERRFKGGDFIIAPTTGLFNQIDDYRGTPGKASVIRPAFEKLIHKLEQKKYSQPDFNLKKRVRLLQDHNDSNHQLKLIFLDNIQLKGLVSADESLKLERESNSVSRDTAFGVPTLECILESKKSEAESSVLSLLADMSTEQRAELLSLIDIARHRICLSELTEETQEKITSRENLDDDYLLSRFGHGYIKYALERFGLHVEILSQAKSD